uniref:ATP synthase subunit a n=4 Tax=Ceratocystis TaxID=5157 RepID=A0A7U1XBJ5_9PEZI|nr:ATP synthase subunit 6 [Ceratocystis lukuohia]YP_010119646.1 ATP synthase subunit 6 [Ceratocystis papillata]YP_010119660.1 ATP synthase subunit 6 [Ceratocystis colombiana]QRB98207.1 ATP synthase subunit 6 [Ceratocystis fimbriata]QRB97997.1 ATP synthase subunit 6 [Ceratocystis lukuohia]QRB98011.1 ATP synthase subunit 6 [Ceratocystis lukuohia]QRB98025.1 ATP synthase subunit 6 [Ceratocystis lukuohia]QRB98039.1 ATP synthase subunit 6 [Ceratocystis lukuohia]
MKSMNTFFNNIQIFSPLDQFEIRNLLSIDLPVLGNLQFSLTNIGLYLIIGTIFIILLGLLSTNYNKLVGDNWSISQEALNATILNTVVGQINPKEGQKFFPFIYTLFIFILINNLIGLVPYSFASTSHMILTISLSTVVVLGATILGLAKHGLKFFSLFVPAGIPLALLPMLVIIEFISYSVRCISLGLRLGANICAGHLLLHILSSFTYIIMSQGVLFFVAGLIPLSFIVAFTGLEFAVAAIQALVFVILTCNYIKDGLDLH